MLNNLIEAKKLKDPIHVGVGNYFDLWAFSVNKKQVTINVIYEPKFRLRCSCDDCNGNDENLCKYKLRLISHILIMR